MRSAFARIEAGSTRLEARRHLELPLGRTRRQGDLHVALISRAGGRTLRERQRDFIAGLVIQHDRAQVIRLVNRLAVDRADHIAGFQSCFRCRAVSHDSSNQCTVRAGQVFARGNVRRDQLIFDAQVRAIYRRCSAGLIRLAVIAKGQCRQSVLAEWKFKVK